VVEHLATRRAALIVDETGLPFGRRHKSVAWGRYTATAGKKKENCQIGVFVAYVEKGSTADREPYLPCRGPEEAGQPVQSRGTLPWVSQPGHAAHVRCQKSRNGGYLRIYLRADLSSAVGLKRAGEERYVLAVHKTTRIQC